VSGRGLDVVITAGAGTAPTELAAFDAALVEHGADQSAVEAQLKATLDDLAARRPGRCSGPAWRIGSAACDIDPLAAVVVAAMRVEP
jgi:hypothetical protein